MNRLFFILIAISLVGCYGVNSETSQIGNMNPTCLDSLAWKSMCEEHSIENITDSNLISRVEDIKNHFIKPDYILYFDEEPKEIIGCDWYSIRVVYNENIADQLLTGISPLLGNDDQKRIRNRVLAEIMKHQCEEGKKETLEAMKKEVPFADLHENYPLKKRSETEEVILQSH